MRANRWYTPWILIAPALVWLLVFSFWPSINTVRLSFTNASPLGGVSAWVGLKNFSTLLADPQVWQALLNSVVYMAICLPLLTILPLLIALLVEKNLPGIAFFRTAYYTPVIASAVVVGLIWTWILDDRGVVNEVAQSLHVIQGPLPFLTDRWLVLFSAISLTVWKGLGYYMIIFLAALGNVGKDLHEAAALDGAGAVRRFWSVTMPGVRGTMTLVGILVCVSALRVFSELYVLTNGKGGPGGQDESLVSLIQEYARGFTGNLGYASALSILLFVVTLVPMLVLARINNKAEQ
ncbi:MULTISPECIES: carbohydrate ABC transporter permease [unclassified Curtobacterium]|uniref:carbohydrate ABC transporter permease n=1 Tax=unclassified Curtobacterium TaxID=257496 RepID=UPI000DAA4554|nr:MULTISPECIES: sugar ABC transporter permease [unclassified Curtobacterium]PZE27121.1 sugar ABC transporter permease [Curtobacterium sp. MCBD17_028]PZE74766.1 sugar ABC transporter permease [Curtobacterium sp. MCBD17_019]PZF60359.1 sugar ABC transporter permease [Curtobacterium sp. MCBD17_034]PZF62748.1 sugar ABC transporter permease [Curtobacterium sp. MCBD17_013]PZM35044.1 sugar ABC transporter permease [Curtobacterium sp. MCBD17_031]